MGSRVILAAGIIEKIKENPKLYAIYAGIGLGCLIALIILGKILYWLVRQFTLGRIAKDLGLSYNWYDRWQSLTRCASLPLFSKSTGGRISAIVHGSKDGVDIRLFDFRRRPDWGPGRLFRWWTTVVLFEMSYDLPFFYLRREKLSDKFASLIGHNDIDDFSNKEFNKTFYVKAAEKQYAHELMPDEMVEFVMERVGDEPINIEVSRSVIAFHLDKVVGRDKVKWLYEFAQDFWERVPEAAVSKKR